MKPIKLTRILHRHAGLIDTGPCYILNPLYIREIFETSTYDPIERKTIKVTELLFADGHKIIVKENVEDVYKQWTKCILNT